MTPLLRGQLFLFDPPKPPAWTSAQGYKLLAILAILELIVRQLLRVSHWPLLARMTLLTALALMLIVVFARVRLPDLGLYGWSLWSRVEKIYFLEIIPITIAIFCVTTWPDLKRLAPRHDWWRIAAFVFIPQMIWGFYQELLYRGMLQAELIRRWGAPIGLLVSNLVFTFGPLHAYHFAQARNDPAHLWIFLAIFAIGLYFALAFHRSGNLWIVGILHGIGDAFMDGLTQIP